MPLRRGVQYASTVFKKAPMYDPAVAARVAEQISAFYCSACMPCSCGQQQHGFECTDTCTSRTPATFDAMPMLNEKCGRFVRGPHKGQLRGWVTIEVVTEGGWKRHGPGERNGDVVRPGQVLSISIGDVFSGKTYLEVR